MTRPLLLGGVLLAALAVSLGVAVAFGSASVDIGDVYHVLVYRLGLGGLEAPDQTVHRIVWDLRMPRVLAAMLVGGGLSIIGVAMQTLVRNPLAEPYLLGISSGASAGASLFYLGFLPAVIARTFSMPVAAFLGGLLAITIVYLVARGRSGISVARLLLAGVAMSAMMASVTSFITLASPEPDKLRAILFWLLGSLSGMRWEMLIAPTIVTAFGLVALVALARPLDAMLVGEEPAQSLGVRVELAKKALIGLAALVTGTLVAISGAIGFVGLIVPHAVRMLVGVPHRKLVPLSFLAGAFFLVWADLFARSVLPTELPVGVVTALCGVPFFLFLLRRSAYSFG